MLQVLSVLVRLRGVRGLFLAQQYLVYQVPHISVVEQAIRGQLCSLSGLTQRGKR